MLLPMLEKDGKKLPVMLNGSKAIFTCIILLITDNVILKGTKGKRYYRHKTNSFANSLKK